MYLASSSSDIGSSFGRLGLGFSFIIFVKLLSSCLQSELSASSLRRLAGLIALCFALEKSSNSSSPLSTLQHVNSL